MKTLIFTFLLLAFVPLIAMADNSLQFKGGIGVDVAQIQTGTPDTVVPNVVCGVQPGTAPWVISHLNASVDTTDGHIHVEGHGLLLAGANVIGTNGNQVVRAELFCEAPAGTCGTPSFTSVGVPLAANGDFQIDDTLEPLPDNPCTNPVLLIINAGGRWFAAGIPHQHKKD